MLNDFGYAILDIAQVEPRDSGEWVVQAHNEQGEANTVGRLNCIGRDSIIYDPQQPQSVQRIIELERPRDAAPEPAAKPSSPPKFVNPLMAMPEILEGDSVHLEAQVTPVDDPNLKIEWFHNGQPLSHGHRYRLVNDFGFCVLDILYATAEDSGEFAIRATNSAGQDVTSTMINCAGENYKIMLSFFATEISNFRNFFS